MDAGVKDRFSRVKAHKFINDLLQHTTHFFDTLVSNLGYIFYYLMLNQIFPGHACGNSQIWYLSKVKSMTIIYLFKENLAGPKELTRGSNNPGSFT